MSKAFTKESDEDDDELQLPALPPGGKNYITPRGYAQLRSELLDLMDNERPKVVEPKSGSYPVAGSASGGLNGLSTGAILSLT